jgi:hypothetical protein
MELVMAKALCDELNKSKEPGDRIIANFVDIARVQLQVLRQYFSDHPGDFSKEVAMAIKSHGARESNARS